MRNRAKIVAAFLDGRRIKGFLYDFSAVRGYFFLFPESDGGAHTSSRGLLVRLAELKALFFVKEFAGNPGYRETHDHVNQPGTQNKEEKIELTFSDGETLVGISEPSPTGTLGFFFTPADAQSNNERIFVITGSVSRLRPLCVTSAHHA